MGHRLTAYSVQAMKISCWSGLKWTGFQLHFFPRDTLLHHLSCHRLADDAPPNAPNQLVSCCSSAIPTHLFNSTELPSSAANFTIIREREIALFSSTVPGRTSWPPRAPTQSTSLLRSMIQTTTSPKRHPPTPRARLDAMKSSVSSDLLAAVKTTCPTILRYVRLRRLLFHTCVKLWRCQSGHSILPIK